MAILPLRRRSKDGYLATQVVREASTVLSKAIVDHRRRLHRQARLALLRGLLALRCARCGLA